MTDLRVLIVGAGVAGLAITHHGRGNSRLRIAMDARDEL
jgi:cation diffusion facilitator CzcD-associated flavoprotein CzcO